MNQSSNIFAQGQNNIFSGGSYQQNTNTMQNSIFNRNGNNQVFQQQNNNNQYGGYPNNQNASNPVGGNIFQQNQANANNGNNNSTFPNNYGTNNNNNNNIFNNNNGQYNGSINNGTMINKPNNTIPLIGSQRGKYEIIKSQLADANGNTTSQATLMSTNIIFCKGFQKLSVLLLRLEDYYLIRTGQLSDQDKQKVSSSISQNCFNQKLLNSPGNLQPPNIAALSRDIRMAQSQYIPNNTNTATNPQSIFTSQNNGQTNNLYNNQQQQQFNNNSNNIFGQGNNTNMNTNSIFSGNNNMNRSQNQGNYGNNNGNIFATNSNSLFNNNTNNNIQQQNSIFNNNRINNNNTGSIFANNTTNTNSIFNNNNTNNMNGSVIGGNNYNNNNTGNIFANSNNNNNSVFQNNNNNNLSTSNIFKNNNMNRTITPIGNNNNSIFNNNSTMNVSQNLNNNSIFNNNNTNNNSIFNNNNNTNSIFRNNNNNTNSIFSGNSMFSNNQNNNNMFNNNGSIFNSNNNMNQSIFQNNSNIFSTGNNGNIFANNNNNNNQYQQQLQQQQQQYLSNNSSGYYSIQSGLYYAPLSSNEYTLEQYQQMKLNEQSEKKKIKQSYFLGSFSQTAAISPEDYAPAFFRKAIKPIYVTSSQDATSYSKLKTTLARMGPQIPDSSYGSTGKSFQSGRSNSVGFGGSNNNKLRSNSTDGMLGLATAATENFQGSVDQKEFDNNNTNSNNNGSRTISAFQMTQSAVKQKQNRDDFNFYHQPIYESKDKELEIRQQLGQDQPLLITVEALCFTLEGTEEEVILDKEIDTSSKIKSIGGFCKDQLVKSGVMKEPTKPFFFQIYSNGTLVKDTEGLVSDLLLRKFDSILQCEVIFEYDRHPFMRTSDFQISPSLEQLQALSTKELKSVSGFTVEGYFGKLEWLNPVDLRDLDIDKTIAISDQQITVYPEADFQGSNKPNIGSGINSRCQITYKNASILTGKVKSGEVSLDVIKTLIEKQCKAQGVELIYFDDSALSWTIIAPHFSVYAFQF